MEKLFKKPLNKKSIWPGKNWKDIIYWFPWECELGYSVPVAVSSIYSEKTLSARLQQLRLGACGLEEQLSWLVYFNLFQASLLSSLGCGRTRRNPSYTLQHLRKALSESRAPSSCRTDVAVFSCMGVVVWGIGFVLTCLTHLTPL